MTRRRRLLLSAAILIGVVAAVLAVLALLPSRPGVSKANFERIQVGMSKEEVGRILQGSSEIDMNFQFSALPPTNKKYWWLGADRASIVVEFNLNGVIDKRFTESTETIADTIRRWLHLAK